MLKLKSHRGMTLVEVIVAAGILAIVLAGFAQMFTMMVKQQNRIDVLQEVNGIVAEMQSLIASRETCIQAFGTNQPYRESEAEQAPDLDNPPDDNGLKLSYFVLPSGAAEAGKEIPGYDLNLERLRLVNGTQTGVDENGDNIYRADLLAVFSTDRMMSGSSGFRERRISSMFVTVNGGNIVSCSAFNLSNEGAVQDMCQSLGGNYSNSQCEMPPKDGEMYDCYNKTVRLRPRSAGASTSDSFKCDGPGGNGYGGIAAGYSIVSLRCNSDATPLRENVTADYSGNCYTINGEALRAAGANASLLCCKLNNASP